MRELRFGVGVLLGLGVAAAHAQQSAPVPRTTSAEPAYALAVASFAPVNADVLIADGDGNNARPLLPSPALDYDASFSRDGHWVVFTSTRDGSADVYRVRTDGTRLEKLTDDPAFDDQGALSPDGDTLAFVSSRGGQADIWTLELKSGQLRNVTSSPGGDFRPQWSPDGRWIAFSSDRASVKPKFTFATLHSTDLYVIRPDGSELRRVTDAGAFAGSPQWTEDGKSLIYYEATVDEVQKIRSPLRLRATTQIAIVDVATGAHRELTSGDGEKWSPHPLPDGRVAYVSGGPDGGLEFTGPRIDDTRGVRRGGSDDAAYVPGARGEMRSPSWSSDGKRMVFHRDVESTSWPPVSAWPSLSPQFRLVRTGVFASYDSRGARLVVNDQKAASLRNSVVLFNSDGAGRRVVFGNPERNALAPAFSPAGDLIAFGVGQFFQAAQGAANADIAVIGADGAGLEVLTNGKGNYGFPSWSPDGKRIVYRAASEQHNGLFIVDVATRKVTTLTEGKAHVNFPKWSPRGDRIAFTSDAEGDYEIYTIEPDGKNLKRVTNRPGNDAHNSWSPDGAWIAFTSEAGGFKDESPIHPYNPQAYGDIYVIRADGTDVRRLTDDQFEDGTPSWIPVPR